MEDVGRHNAVDAIAGTAPKAAAAASELASKTLQNSILKRSDQFDVKLQIAGLNVGFNRTVTRLGNRPGSESTWYFKDEKLLAVDAINDGRSFLIAKKLLENKNNPEMSKLEDSSFDIKALL